MNDRIVSSGREISLFFLNSRTVDAVGRVYGCHPSGFLLPIPAQTERVGIKFGTFFVFEEAVGRVAQIHSDVTVTCLCQEVNAYRVDIQAAVQILFMSVDLCFRLGSMTDFRFKSG